MKSVKLLHFFPFATGYEASELHSKIQDEGYPEISYSRDSYPIQGSGITYYSYPMKYLEHHFEPQLPDIHQLMSEKGEISARKGVAGFEQRQSLM